MEEKFRRRMVRAAQEARKEATPAEKALWAMVRGKRCGGFYFRRQAIMASFRVDFYCEAASLSIELDGSVHDEPEVRSRDGVRQAILEKEFGICFLRITNDDVLIRSQETLQRIQRTAQELARRQDPLSGFAAFPPQGWEKGR